MQHLIIWIFGLAVLFEFLNHLSRFQQKRKDFNGKKRNKKV